MNRIFLFGALCVAGLASAAHAPIGERKAALSVAGVVVGVWLLFVMPWIYEPFSPAGILYRMGFTEIQHIHIWLVTDTIASMAVISISPYKNWSVIVWLAFIGMIATLGAGSAWLEYAVYHWPLDILFLLQITALFIVGGPGVVCRLSDLRDLVRNASHSFALSVRRALGWSQEDEG